MVKSKYSLHAIAGIFAFSAITCLVFYFSTTLNLFGKSKKTGLPNFVLILLMLALVLFFLFRLLKIIPNIRISDKNINISSLVSKTKILTDNDIKKINLFAYGSVMSWITIVTRIELTNDEIIEIANPEYRNIGEIRLALIENFPDKIKSFQSEGENTDNSRILESDLLKFSGNPVFNFNTIMFGGLMLFIAFNSFFPYRPKDTWFVLFFCLPLLYFILGHQSHYFLVEKKYFIVKNHFFFWRNKIYKIENIVACNFEYVGGSSKSLRITTKDFKSRYYSAGSLREKDWKALKDKIDEWGIYFIP